MTADGDRPAVGRFRYVPPPTETLDPETGEGTPNFSYGYVGQVAALAAAYPFLDDQTCRRLVRSYGTRAPEVLGEARLWVDLGEDFGAGLTAREVRYLQAAEWAQTADDILWRRSKLGLRFDGAARARLGAWLAAHPVAGADAAD